MGVDHLKVLRHAANSSQLSSARAAPRGGPLLQHSAHLTIALEPSKYLFCSRLSGARRWAALLNEIAHRLELRSHAAYLERCPADVGEQAQPDHHVRHHQIGHTLHGDTPLVV